MMAVVGMMADITSVLPKSQNLYGYNNETLNLNLKSIIIKLFAKTVFSREIQIPWLVEIYQQ